MLKVILYTHINDSRKTVGEYQMTLHCSSSGNKFVYSLCCFFFAFCSSNNGNKLMMKSKFYHSHHKICNKLLHR